MLRQVQRDVLPHVTSKRMLFFVASLVKTSLSIDIAEMKSERKTASFRLQSTENTTNQS